MKTLKQNTSANVLALAAQGVLAAMLAWPLAAQAAEAEEDAVAALKRPANTVEIGAAHVSKDSAKFGEYSGLDESGVKFIGNFEVRGGNAYEGGEGATRWEFIGSDLGTTSRSVHGALSNQGQWSLNLGYDELRHNITDTYQTPQQGSMGGNNFTMPGNFGTINGGASPSARSLDATQLGAFHTEQVGTTRKNISFGAGYIFNQQLSLQFDFNHLDQSGAKLIGVSALGGVATPLGGTWRAEAINIIMNPTNYKTDSINLTLNWAGDKGHLSGGYYGSIFRDGYDSLSSQNALSSAGTALCASGGACTYQTNTMSTAPDNSFHQLNLSGRYAFSTATKLAGGLSYGRNTQNNNFLSGQTEIVSAPRSSLDGLVITTHADLKLTHQASKALALSAGVKYNERDNRSPSNTYRYYAINNLTTVDSATNAPYSNRKTQLELAADYRLSKRQNLRLAYEYEDIKRWCRNYAIATSNCLLNPGNQENKLGVTYRLKAREDLSFNAGYSYAKRKADFDGNAITPLGGLDADSGTLVNAQNYPGYVAYPYASRKQQMLKAGLTWQATEQWDLGLNGRYSHDDYNTVLGVQDGRTLGLNLDASYAYAENASVSAYASWQSSKRKLKAGATGAGADNTATSYSALVAPPNVWTNRLKEDSDSIGLNAKHSGLMGGKLEVIGDLSYSLDKSRYSTEVPYDATCGTAAVLTCGDAPDIKSKLITLKLTGNYQMDKRAKVSLGYLYQKLTSNDYVYNAEQYGYTPNRVMPTNQQAPGYSVNVVTATYIYTFK